MDDIRLEIPAAPIGACLRLQRELGLSFPVAQVLVRRGLADPAAARAFLAADERHDPAAFGGMDAAVALIGEHVRRGSRIVVHGDYDADGVCSTAILVRTLRDLGADAGWFLPSRIDDGYGLSAATVERLAAEGTGLLVTVDCAITAVEEVALARALGLDVVVTDHHQPRADGALPDAPIVHPLVGGYPAADLCAAGVAHLLAGALRAAAGEDPARADEDLDIVALATVADCVPLRGENRRLVREGLAALAVTRREGLRALLRVAQAEPGAIDEQTIAFRLAPRINAAGRVHRADAGVELLLTADPDRAERIAHELDAANGERRHVETRIVFEAEAQLATLGERAGYVLAADGWHPGVVGIVASRLAERHHRPMVLVALDGAEGTGSGRSIPAFDLLGALDACSSHLLRHGGHRAAAGCTVARAEIDAFRAAFDAHAAAVLRPDDLIPTERVDAVISGDEAGMALAEELRSLAPHGIGNPRPSLLVPAARLTAPRQMGEGKHVRFTVESGGGRASGVAFGRGRLPDGHDEALDAVFGLEVNRWNGREEARLVLRAATPPPPGAPELLGAPAGFAAWFAHELAAPLPERVPAPAALPEPALDRRGAGVLGTLGAIAASGEPALVLAACAERRLAGLRGRIGGLALCSWDALERDPGLAAPFAHLVALDPPAAAAHEAALAACAAGRMTHLAWGGPELRFTQHVAEQDHTPRTALIALYRALRDRAGEPLEAVLRGVSGAPRTAVQAARLVRVLAELGLAELDLGAGTVVLPEVSHTDLERSSAFRAHAARAEEGRRWLSRAAAQAA